MGPYWTFLVLTALQIEDNRHWPALQAPIQESHDHPMAPKCHSRLTQGLRKAFNIGVQNGIRRQSKARGPVWGPTGPFLCSQHSKLKITDIGQPFVACPALQAPMQESHDHLMAPKHHSRLTQGLRKDATKTRLMTSSSGHIWPACVCMSCTVSYKNKARSRNILVSNTNSSQLYIGECFAHIYSYPCKRAY